MLLHTESMPFRKVRRTNATDTSFPSRVPTATEPVSAGTASATSQDVIDLLTPGVHNGGVQTRGLFVPYMLGDDNDVMAVRVIGWRRVGINPETDLWIPVKLAEVTCTGCAAVGVAGMAVLNTERFCDTLALVDGNDDVSIDIVSPEDDTVGHFVLDLKGFTKIEITFDMTTGDPTSGNCLVALY